MSRVTPLPGQPAPAPRLHGEYETRGEYHRQLDKAWKYYPVFVHKMALVRRFLDCHAAGGRTIDLGCGEGILVEEYRHKGFEIVGLDANFESPLVIRGDMTDLPFDDESFDFALALDVIEHLSFTQQERALAEVWRVLKPEGRALFTIPNLAHFASRVTFALLGRLLRTSTIDRHPGDRPIQEYVDLCRASDLELVSRRGLFPTYPLISALTWLMPCRVVGLHAIYNRLGAIPGFCFLNAFELKKKARDRNVVPFQRPRRRSFVINASRHAA